jgi:hypothetical protein
VVEGTGPRRAEERFQFGEGLFDRVEVRAVGRKKPDMRARPFNRRANLRLLVHRQVVEHDDVAGAQRGDQDLFDVREECRIVDGPIEHSGRGEPVEAQARNDRVRLPMAARRMVMQPRPAGAAAIPPQQVGGDAALIEKDVLSYIAQRLQVLPLAARRGDVRTPLFVRVYGFF